MATYWNNYKGHMDNNKSGWKGEGGGLAGVVGRGGGKGRKLLQQQ